MSVQLAAGAELAGYRIVRVLGRGGMGVVYLAEDLRLGRLAALKVVKEDLADDARFRERFLRESRLVAGLDHPSIVPVYGAGDAEGVLYLAMRYVAGSDLRAVLRDQQRLAPGRALRILDQIAGALDAAHQAGLVHRDVKPANILLTGHPDRRDEHAYLADFGLAKRPATADSATGSGAILGTLAYAAPEQIEGAAVDGRADIYSLACVLFECLAGHPPYPADTDVGVVYAHLQQPPPRLSDANGDVPAALDEVIARGLAKRPADRYPFADDLIDAARAAFPDATGRRRRLSLAAALAAAGAAALAALTVYVVDRNATSHPATPTAAAAAVDRGALLMLDAGSGRTIRSVPLDSRTPGQVAVANGTVFVSEPDVEAVARIDESSGLQSSSIPVRGAGELASDGDAVWAVGRADAGGLALRRLPLTGGQPTQSIPLPESAFGVAVSGSAAWYSRDRADGTRELVRVATDRPDPGQIVRVRLAWVFGPIVVAGGTPFALAANEPDGMTELVERADRDTTTAVASMAHLGRGFTPGAEDIIADGEWLWVLAEDGTLWQVDPARRVIVGSVKLGSGPWSGLAAAPAGVWVANQRDDTIVRVDRTTLTPSRPVRVGGSPRAIAARGDHLYVSVMPSAALPTSAPDPHTLRIVTGDDLDYWDGTSYFGDAWQMEFLTCNGLLDYRSSTDPSRQLDLVPGVAASYPQVSADGRTYTFRIRRGLRFHDGRSVTAADVKATFERNLDPAAGFDALGSGYFNDIAGVAAYVKKTARGIAGIAVTGDQVTFRLTRRDPAFPYAIAMRFMCVVPRGTAHAHGTTPPPMTGPFQITSSHAGASLVLQRNRYGTENAQRLGVPNMAGVDRVEVTFGYTDQDQIAAVAAGRADLTLGDPRTSTTLKALAAPDIAGRMTTGPASAIGYLTMNTTSGPLAHPEARRAVNLALDRRSLVRAPGVVAPPYAWSGYLPRTLTEAGTPSPYPDDADPAAARRLLARSGLTPPVHVNLWWFAGHADNDGVAHAVKAELDRAGFDVQLRPAWGPYFFTAVVDPRQHIDMALAGWAADFQDPVTFLPQLLGHTEFNYGHYDSRQFAERARAAAAVPIGPARLAAWTRLALDLARNDAPLAVVADRDTLRVHSDRVRDLVITAPKEVDLSLLQLR